MLIQIYKKMLFCLDIYIYDDDNYKLGINTASADKARIIVTHAYTISLKNISVELSPSPHWCPTSQLCITVVDCESY